MKMKHFRAYRGMSFVKRGMRIKHDGRNGRISGANSSCNLNITFDGDNYSQNCHPYWKMKYFDDDGKLIAEYGE